MLKIRAAYQISNLLCTTPGFPWSSSTLSYNSVTPKQFKLTLMPLGNSPSIRETNARQLESTKVTPRMAKYLDEESTYVTKYIL